MKPKAIFFDTSDTLYHCPKLEAEIKKAPVQFITEKKGVTEDESSRMLEEGKKKRKQKGLPTTKSGILMDLGFKNEDWQNFISAIDTDLFLVEVPENVFAIENLSKEYILGIITNINKSFLLNVLKSIRVKSEYFQFMITSDDVKKPKPDVEPFMKVIKLLNLPANQIYYVGDNIEKDLVPAKKSGMGTIFISKNEDNEISGNYDYRVNSLSEITNLF